MAGVNGNVDGLTAAELSRVLVLREFAYDHPLLDSRAAAAQTGFAALQGVRNTWYAGAWLRHGFHEDGVKSAHAVATGIARLGTVSARLPMAELAAA